MAEMWLYNIIMSLAQLQVNIHNSMMNTALSAALKPDITH